jgi:hypothetical protein
LKGNGYVPAIRSALITTRRPRPMTELFTAPPATIVW